MTESPRQSLSPGFWTIEYTSRHAPHVLTLPTRLPIFTGFGLPNINYATWAGGTVSAEDMKDALILKLGDIHLTTTSLDVLRIYSQPTPSDFPQLIAAVAIGADGTDDTVGWDEAVQLTLTGKDTAGNDCRHIALDISSGNNFGRLSLGDIATAYKDLWAVLADQEMAFSSRKGFCYDALIQQSVTLNEKLRRGYHLQ